MHENNETKYVAELRTSMDMTWPCASDFPRLKVLAVIEELRYRVIARMEFRKKDGGTTISSHAEIYLLGINLVY